MAFSAVMMGLSWQVLGVPLWLAAFLGIGVGALAGYLNGLIIVYLGVPPLIVTLLPWRFFADSLMGLVNLGLLTASRIRSLFGVVENSGYPGSAVYSFDYPDYKCDCFGSDASWGSIYAIGNNETAARFAGLRVGSIKILAYTMSGMMAGVAGSFLLSGHQYASRCRNGIRI